jgi:drug/metabolite transporter (DMT)-like permease
MPQMTSSQPERLNRAGLFHLLIIYFVWGSTYLAIRVGVRSGAGFTPFVFGATRVLTAGLILLAVAGIFRYRLRLTKKELLVLAGSGLLLWVCGNGLVMAGEIHADSGLAALIISATPIWAMLLESLIDRKRPSLILVGSLLVGTLGIVVLSMPLIVSGIRADALSVLFFILGSLFWAGGTVLQARLRLQLDATVLSGYQMFFAGVGFAAAALLLKEPFPNPIPQAWLAWSYLVVFGSLIAFTSYIKVIRLLPTRVVMTYSYVNPIIAIILGWLILGEKITLWTIAGAALILVGVAGVFRSRSHSMHPIKESRSVQSLDGQHGSD